MPDFETAAEQEAFDVAIRMSRAAIFDAVNDRHHYEAQHIDIGDEQSVASRLGRVTGLAMALDIIRDWQPRGSEGEARDAADRAATTTDLDDLCPHCGATKGVCDDE